MKMVLIPPGEFLMGSTEEEIETLLKEGEENEWLSERWTSDIRSEGPQHRVQISTPFYFAATEVTVGQFSKFADTADYKSESEREPKGAEVWGEFRGKKLLLSSGFTWRDPSFSQTNENPCVRLTWNDARAFCRWLGSKEQNVYGLPSEAQWEYACRAGSTSRWFTGDNQSDLEQYARYGGDVSNGPMPVGKKLPNAFGLFDMLGNSWEWCSDWYGESYYASSPAIDPHCADSGKYRVLRGGAVSHAAHFVRCARRFLWTSGVSQSQRSWRLPPRPLDRSRQSEVTIANLQLFEPQILP